jgi:REP element-mobilizing transposase RayT
MPNTYSQIYFHYVFSPKYRHSLINSEVEEEIYKYISGITKNRDQKLISINGMPDHIHLLVRLRPSIAPSKFIQTIKTNSSRWINEKAFFKNKFAWQVGGGVFSVSHRNIPDLKIYIENQKEHHKKVSFREEYIKLLKHYGVSFEEKYLLDFF